jgi:hypothetical protein
MRHCILSALENAMRRPLTALALLLLAPLVYAQAYKWTDANGTVHYSQTPPPAGTKYSQITLSGSAQAPAPPANTEPAAASTAPAANPSAPVADTPENRARLCSQLKTNLDTLHGGGPVVMQQGTQQVVMNADQRQQQLGTAEAQYQQYCTNQ